MKKAKYCLDCREVSLLKPLYFSSKRKNTSAFDLQIENFIYFYPKIKVAPQDICNETFVKVSS
jgi:hypothetical protein